jgi:hypothetical protein
MKYTADDLLKALKHSLYEVPYEQYVEFKASLMGVDKEDLDALSEKDVFSLAYELGAEKFLDAYNEYLKNFNNTLHVGDVYRIIDTERPTVHGCDRAVITEYNAEEDKYYCLLSDGTFDFASNDEFDFDNAEKIGSIDTNTFIHSKNDLINKLNEL